MSIELFQDKELQCPCGETFLWTKGEQKFMQGLLYDKKISEVIPPKRCKSCRDRRKAERESKN